MMPAFPPMKINQSNVHRWLIVALYAVAMAWVEAAVVFYLRTMIDRLEPHQPNPLPVVGGFAAVELPREFATLVMLFTVGVLAGRTWRARWGYALIAFGAGITNSTSCAGSADGTCCAGFTLNALITFGTGIASWAGYAL